MWPQKFGFFFSDLALSDNVLFEFNVFRFGRPLARQFVLQRLDLNDKFVVSSLLTELLTANKMKCRFNRISCLPIEGGQISVNSGKIKVDLSKGEHERGG